MDNFQDISENEKLELYQEKYKELQHISQILDNKITINYFRMHYPQLSAELILYYLIKNKK